MRRKACFIILLITLSLIGHSYIIFASIMMVFFQLAQMMVWNR